MEKKVAGYRNEIIALPKETWKGTAIPLVTRSNSYYDLEIHPLDRNGCIISLARKQAEEEIVHTPEEYEFPDSLYQEHWENAEAFGIVSEDGDLLAYVRRNGQTGLWLQNCGCLMGFVIRGSGRG